jgi:hypothetical protein
MRTLETGSDLSTLIFALGGARQTSSFVRLPAFANF